MIQHHVERKNMYYIRHDCANKDIRISCIEHGIKFWQIAMQLDKRPEAVSRELRVELDPEEKKKYYWAIEQIIKGR